MIGSLKTLLVKQNLFLNVQIVSAQQKNFSHICVLFYE